MSVVSSRNSLPRTILIVHHIHVAYSRHSSNLETCRNFCPKWGRPGLIHHMISVAAYVTKVESLVRPRNTLWSGLIDQGIWSHSIFLGQTRGSAFCTPHLEILYCSLRSEWHKCCTKQEPFRMLCAIRTWLQRRWRLCCSYTIVWLILCFKGIESLWTWRGRSLVAKCRTLERAPTPIFGRLEKCSALGHSFARLWYVIDMQWHEESKLTFSMVHIRGSHHCKPYQTSHQ